MPTVKHRIVSSQVDWLTVTRRCGPENVGLLGLGEAILANQLPVDPSVCQWTWHGYSGKRGEHFAYGRRYDGDILQLSGDLAADHFQTAFYLQSNCSRIDLAVTVKYEPMQEGIADGVYRQCKAWRTERGTGPDCSLVVNSGGGSTAYIGSRTSDLFARCYDKWRESPEPENVGCWRWEVEAKGDIASRIGARLLVSTNRAADIKRIVATHFTRRGAAPDWAGDDLPLRVPLERKSSTVASRLCWLSSSVRPVINKLLLCCSEDEIIDALGLSTEQVNRARVRLSDAFDGHRLRDLDSDQCPSDLGEV